MISVQLIEKRVVRCGLDLSFLYCLHETDIFLSILGNDFSVLCIRKPEQLKEFISVYM